ncbi:MAG: alpha/beta hydrolase [Roseovarius sp.]
MSRRAQLLNFWLRWTEKPHLARIESPLRLRRSFELKSRLFFRRARGTRWRADEVGGVPVLRIEPWPPAAPGAPCLLYLHGGGYMFGSPRTHLAMVSQIVARTGFSACLPRYRLAPEHPFPAAVEDALAVLGALGHAPSGVILGGDSAGGGLALSVLAEALARGGPVPRACFALSPLTDLTFSGESVRGNARADVMLPAARAEEMAALYLADTPRDDPRASPLFARFEGAPPVWLAVGDTEILLDDTRRMEARLRAAGVAVEEVIARDLPHVWPFFHGYIPEAGQTLDALAGWLAGVATREEARSGDS